MLKILKGWLQYLIFSSHLFIWLHSVSYMFLRDEFISTCQFGITSFLDTIPGKSNITAYIYLPRCDINAISKNFIRQMFFCPIWYCKRNCFFLIILHRLCIHLTKRRFKKRIAWQMVKRTFYDLWIMCAPLNYIWSRIIKRHKNHARITTSSIICK